MESEDLLLLLLGTLIRNYESTCKLPHIHKKQDGINYGILQYIEENYVHITLQELADKFHYTPHRMSALLKELTVWFILKSSPYPLFR